MPIENPQWIAVNEVNAVFQCSISGTKNPNVSVQGS
jgi:hypothetical protein